MSTPIDADARVARLAAELAELGRRLAWARHELLSLPIAGTVPQAPSVRPPSEQAPPAVPPPAVPPPTVPPQATPPPHRTPPHRPPAKARLSSGRVLAWVGGSMTLIGVVLFLVLAAGRGWFGIPARLVAGAVLGLALAGLGARLHRRPGGEVGALALAATGIAALYLDVGAATATYHYLPTWAGVGAGLVVAGAGLWLADRWRSAQLAAAVLLGAGILMPVVAGESLPVLVALVLALQVAAIPVVVRRGGPATAVIGAAFPLVYGSALAWDAMLPLALWPSAARPTVADTATVVAVFLVGVAAAVAGARTLSAGLAAGLLVAAPLPALQLAVAHGGGGGALLAAATGVVLLVVALVPGPVAAARPRVLRLGAAAAGAVALFQATTLWLDGAVLTGVLLGQALTLALVCRLTGRRGPLLAATGYGVAGLWLAVGRDAPLAALVSFPATPYVHLGRADVSALVTGLALSLLVLLVAVAYTGAAARLGLVRDTPRSAALWGTTGVVGLYGLAGVVVTTGLLIAPVRLGFVTAHAVVTISWTLAALLLLARGLSRPVPRVTGLLLVAAAVAKLLLFDLVALDGLARVAAFVGAGLVLLAAGSRYARLVAAQQADEVDGLPGQRPDDRQPGQPDQPGDHRDGVLDQGHGPGQTG